MAVPNSSPLLLLLLLYYSLACFFFSLSTASLSQDALSLLSFKSAISMDPSSLLLNWNPLSDPCSWYGVHCDPSSARVISLNITGRSPSFPNFTANDSVLVGNLPPSIANLTDLRVLSIPHNLFSGVIPAEIGQMASLEVLELQGNNFSGTIPYQIRYLSSLRLLNLSYNALSGPIPAGFIGMDGKLNLLDLSNNQLSGSVEADEFGKCDNLYHLKLSNNILVDEIPSEIGNCSNLRTLLLDGNIFQGKIPVHIGRISELVILDISRNSLTGRIPRELANCSKLSVVVLTNLVDFSSTGGSEDIDEDGNAVDTYRGEFNAFDGTIPNELLLLPNLEMIWAPRANLRGCLPSNWSKLCSLRVLNLGQNYITGEVPGSLSMCKDLTFLDLNSNGLKGNLSSQLQVPCMVYLNVSRNSLSGVLSEFSKNCDGISKISFGDEYVQNAYSNILVWGSQMTPLLGSTDDDKFVVTHDFSWNKFNGLLPSFSIGDEFLVANSKASHTLLLNNNKFTGPIPILLSSNCNDLHSFSVNLSVNHIGGRIDPAFLRNCSKLRNLEAQENLINGSISRVIGRLKKLQRLDLRRNWLFGALPAEIGELKDLTWILLGENNLTGSIPAQLGQLNSLLVLDLSQNNLTGSIPETLSNAKNLEILLLNHNILSGEIPWSFTSFPNLSLMDLSFNNLSGPIPRLPNSSDCDSFRGNLYIQPCPDPYAVPPAKLPVPLQVKKSRSWSKLRSFVIAMAISASVVLFILSVIVLALILGKRKLSRSASLPKKVVVTFVDTPIELNYDNVVGATGNFSIRNLIGTGGFGSTYKAELIPGFLVAVKRLSIGRFQGIKQFDAEIRTLGRIRQNNLVTLIGYHVGEAEMFLIYNYLCGGNLETFIHERPGKNVRWQVIHKIALDIAQALSFLHYSCVPRIVHRDIKPSNILLDEEHNAYLSDFGLARLLEVSETHATTDVAGTFGYVAPEYATTCRVSDKADVYSFGVVLLELMSRKKSLDPSFSEYGNGFNIVAWAKLLIEEGRASELFSPELWATGPNENLLRMLRLASACTVESLSVRPTMKQVLQKLKQLQP